VCIGGGLTGSTFECGGGVAWVRLHVDVDGSGGSGDEGLRMKGKGRIRQESWLDE
jgi:hypothetical protein